MKIIKYSLNTIYKELRQICDKDCSNSIGIIANTDTFEELFLRRFFVNRWNECTKYYYVITEINNKAVYNLSKGIDLFDQGVILDLQDNYPKEYIYSIINFCIENNKNIYIPETLDIGEVNHPSIYRVENIYAL